MSSKVHTLESVLQSSWWPQLLAIKDTRTYRQLEEQFGVNTSMIRHALEHTGMHKKPMPRGRPRKSPFGAPPTAGQPKPAVAKAPTQAKKRRGRTSKLDPFLHLVGQVPDSQVAKMAGITPSAVAV